MDTRFLIEQIKTFVSIQDVFDKYVGSESDMHGRYQCPFNHLEDRRNFAIKHNKMWHCFSCGSSGDQITLVQKLFDLPFNEALLKIAEDFNLATEKDERMSLKMRIECQRRLLQREKDKRYAIFMEKLKNNLFEELLEIRDLLEKIISKTDIDTIQVDNYDDKIMLYSYTKKCKDNMYCRARLEKVNRYIDILCEIPIEDDYATFFDKDILHERAEQLVQDIINGKITI